jgi:hypothetical protein
VSLVVTERLATEQRSRLLIPFVMRLEKPPLSSADAGKATLSLPGVRVGPPRKDVARLPETRLAATIAEFRVSPGESNPGDSGRTV